LTNFCLFGGSLFLTNQMVHYYSNCWNLSHSWLVIIWDYTIYIYMYMIIYAMRSVSFLRLWILLVIQHSQEKILCYYCK
jgi:hypothetical protein